jgi:voltage-gated potassium channel
MKATRDGQFKALARAAGDRIGRWRSYLSGLLHDMRKTGLTRLVLFLLVAVFAATISVFALERANGEGGYRNLFDGLWWAVVTVATVGYGDLYPRSGAGRLVAMLFILSGFVFTALISGTVASIFVERRIREGKGLREVNMKGHTLICGWNKNSARVIAALSAGASGKALRLVLVNEREGDWFEPLKAQFPAHDIRFVRGDFGDEAVLRRAAAAQAQAAVILPDETGTKGSASSDERGILAALTLRALNPDMPISAEILKEESEAHMRRAGVANVIVNGEFTAFFLSSASCGAALTEAARRIMSIENKESIRQSKIPSSLVGKSFLEASADYLRGGRGILIGVMSEEKGVSLEDLMSDDSSAIDAFIRKKFAESSLDMGAAARGGAEIKLNPGPGYLLRENDVAFVIG